LFFYSGEKTRILFLYGGFGFSALRVKYFRYDKEKTKRYLLFEKRSKNFFAMRCIAAFLLRLN